MRASLPPQGHRTVSGDAFTGFGRGQGAPSSWWVETMMPQGTGRAFPPLGRVRPGAAAALGLGDPDASLRSAPAPATTVCFPLRSACMAGI